MALDDWRTRTLGRSVGSHHTGKMATVPRKLLLEVLSFGRVAVGRNDLLSLE
jgi:hypothetical protein